MEFCVICHPLESRRPPINLGIVPSKTFNFSLKRIKTTFFFSLFPELLIKSTKERKILTEVEKKEAEGRSKNNRATMIAAVLRH